MIFGSSANVLVAISYGFYVWVRSWFFCTALSAVISALLTGW